MVVLPVSDDVSSYFFADGKMLGKAEAGDVQETVDEVGSHFLAVLVVVGGGKDRVIDG